MSEPFELNVEYKGTKIMIIACSLQDLAIKSIKKFNLPTDTPWNFVNDQGSQIDDDLLEYLSKKRMTISFNLHCSSEGSSTETSASIQSFKKYCYSILNGKNHNSSTQQINISRSAKLRDLSNSILYREGYNKEKYMCSFYTNYGHPLVGRLSSMDYISCAKLLVDSEFIYVIIAPYFYPDSRVGEINYTRSSILNLKDKENNHNTIPINVNFEKDTIKSLKHLLGLEINENSSRIILDYSEIRKNVPFSVCPNEDSLLSVFGLSNNETKDIHYHIQYWIKDEKKHNAYVEQSKKGYNVFRGLLYCLPHHNSHNFFKFISCIRYFTNNFIPACHALYSVSKNKRILETEYCTWWRPVSSIFNHLKYAST